MPTRPADYAALLAARSRLPLHPPAGHRDYYRKVLESHGTEQLLEAYGNGAGLTEIAMNVGVPVLALQEYLETFDKKRWASAKKARAAVLMEMARAAAEFVSSNPAEAASQRVLVETLKFEASMLDEGLQPAKTKQSDPNTVSILIDLGAGPVPFGNEKVVEAKPIEKPKLDVDALFPWEDGSTIDADGKVHLPADADAVDEKES